MLLETNIVKNLSLLDIKTLSLKSDDVDITGNFYRSKTFKLNVDINKLNLDDIIINTRKSILLTDDSAIMIFKVNNIEELQTKLSSENDDKKIIMAI